MFNLLPFVLLSFGAGAALAQDSDTVTASSIDWNGFNKTVGGHLRVATPFAKPCFSSGASNAAQCSQIASNNENHLFRTDFPGAYSITQWETCQTTGDGCLLDWHNTTNQKAFTAPEQCGQGSVPNYYVEVHGASDVTATLSFVKKNNVPFVIKNTGHDYLGRSSAPGSLALWTTYNAKYQPQNCASVKPQSAITIGAGVQFQTAYEFAKENGVVFLGGADPSVGASGGWVMGGGHSGLSPSYGLGVDRVLEFKIITPDGQLRVANKCNNADLFWALRGGGGGTFGIVLESTFVASPNVPVQVVLGMYGNTKANSTKLIKQLAKSAVQMGKDGWGGYITPSLASAVWLNPVLNEAQAKASAAGVVSAFAAVNGTTQFFVMPTYTDFFNTFIAPNTDAVGRPQALVTRLIPDKSFTDQTLIDSVTDGLVNSDFGQILVVAPYAYKDFDPSATSINPEFRNAVWHALVSYFWNYDATPASITQTYQKLEAQWATVRQRTPNAAVYYNEADVYEPDWQTRFWGNNYARLLQIKNKYDPTHLLDCWRCVGWKGQSNSKYKCYAKVPGTSTSRRDEL
ncbi:FAD-binding domain-containing protein [Crepidotus variabilis]|uniref:FAD-binding domain-containing protein n=1 Tax=Crepidotus variabilis TaxID=179855 RepID=A0A9P6JWK8_9AGAR|nr:FAD-binding domain-containing protein [Crepidotus variabilis]